MSSDAIGPPAPGDRRPPAGLALVALLAGASAIGLAPVLVRLSELGPTATAFWRVALAVPLLALFAALRGSALRGTASRGSRGTDPGRPPVRGRSRALAPVDPLHLGGQRHPARQPGADPGRGWRCGRSSANVPGWRLERRVAARDRGRGGDARRER
ncbi:MAG: hypothetical protein RML12_10100 [Xanthomonadales bacterium]|nr:hypothetical protein [Xanthomonadales bacterium]